MGPTSIGIINAAAFAATLPAGSGERSAFENLFLYGGTMNRNRLGDREQLRKLEVRDTVQGRPGLIASAFKQGLAMFNADVIADTLPERSDERRAFEILFVHHGLLNQGRLADREALLKLKQADTAKGKLGLIAKALTQFGV